MPSDEPTDALLEQLESLIERFGWAVRHVGGDGTSPGFSYTVGLTGLGHPEFVMTGIPFDAAQGFLNLLGAEVRDGNRFVPGMIVHDLTEPPAPIAIVSVVDASGLTAVEQLFGRMDALQAVWSDSLGNLPWRAGYRNTTTAQPLLGPVPPSLLDDDTA